MAACQHLCLHFNQNGLSIPAEAMSKPLELGLLNKIRNGVAYGG